MANIYRGLNTINLLYSKSFLIKTLVFKLHVSLVIYMMPRSSSDILEISYAQKNLKHENVGKHAKVLISNKLSHHPLNTCITN